jgi:precorrin-2/cobalt-factor-2 C20-methyltransferase
VERPQVTGTLYGIGVGPGDPELLTLKAARLIRACPVVAYPRANGVASLARSIAASHFTAETLELPYDLPMVSRMEPARAAYDALANALAATLDEGRDVAVLCEGDPLFYGSFAGLMDRLAGRARIEVVPGVSSAHAAAAALCQPIVQRNASWTVLPATLSDQALEDRLRFTDAAALFKLGRHLDRIRCLLARLGLTDRSNYAERVGQPGERLLPLRNLKDEHAPYFALILVGMPSS